MGRPAGMEGGRKLSEDITFCQLRTFVCVARLGSFVKAADSMGISQPAVSDQISTLEKRLREPLFHRRRGTTPILTPRGLAVLQEAEAILASSERLLQNAGADGDREIVRVAIGPHLRDRFLNPLISEVYRQYPKVDVELQRMHPYEDAMRRLNSGDLDLVVSTVLPIDDFAPEAVSAWNVPVALHVSGELADRLARGEMKLEELDLLVPFNRTQRSARWMTHSLKEAGLNFVRPPRFLNNGEMVHRIAVDGLGVGYLMPETVEESLASGSLEMLDIELPPLSRIVASTPGRSHVVQFIESKLRTALASTGRLAA